MLNNIRTIHKGTRYRIKDQEKAEVFHYVCQHYGATRKEIANITDIRPSSVSTITEELLSQKLIYQGDNRNIGKKGRPEISLHPNFNRFLCIALYVVSQKITGVLLNFNEEILEEKTVTVPHQIDNIKMIELLKNLILSIAVKSPRHAVILGVGISLRGAVNFITGEILDSSRWSSLNKLSIHILEETTGFKCILYYALNSELEYLLIKNPSYRDGGTVLYHWGYGIGASYSNNGTIIRSKLGSFLEVGHIQVDSKSKMLCKCGKLGCLETKAALWALIPRLEKKYPDIPSDENDFYEYCISRNLVEEPSVQEGISYIITNIEIVHSILFPDRILLTGPFTNDKRIFSAICDQLYDKLPEYSRDHTKLEVLNNKFSGEIFGSTYGFFQKALSKELIHL